MPRPLDIANVLSLHLSYGWQTQARGLCQKVNAHLYTVSSVDKIAAVIVISICFCHDTTLAQVSAVKQLNASGRGLW